MNIYSIVLQFGGSLAAILLLAWLAYFLRLGNRPSIATVEQVRMLANEVVYGFEVSDCAVDENGLGAICADRHGRLMVIKPHGSHFAGRILTPVADAQLASDKLAITTGERRFGMVRLELIDAEQWMRRINALGDASNA